MKFWHTLLLVITYVNITYFFTNTVLKVQWLQKCGTLKKNYCWIVCIKKFLYIWKWFIYVHYTNYHYLLSVCLQLVLIFNLKMHILPISITPVKNKTLQMILKTGLDITIILISFNSMKISLLTSVLHRRVIFFEAAQLQVKCNITLFTFPACFTSDFVWSADFASSCWMLFLLGRWYLLGKVAPRTAL